MKEFPILPYILVNPFCLDHQKPSLVGAFPSLEQARLEGKALVSGGQYLKLVIYAASAILRAVAPVSEELITQEDSI